MITNLKTICVLLTLSLLAAALAGCTASITTGAAKPSPPPAAANTNTATTGKKTDKPKPAEKLKDEKKPEGETGKVAKKIEVPKDWIYVYDDQKGYGFYVPEGSTGGNETVNGVSVFSANTPSPAEVGVMVLAYKNEKLSKDDLLNDAVKVLEALGEKVTAGKLASESEDYSLAEASSTSADNVKSKYKILVGTDVTDNYVMIVGADESKFAANEKVIDEIWGNFEMWSGGSSGNN